jgi:hypothetical protein
MAPIRMVVSALGLALTAARHPAVRAGIKVAAPIVLNPRNREKAAEAARTAAYGAGVLVRRLSPKKFLDR